MNDLLMCSAHGCLRESRGGDFHDKALQLYLYSSSNPGSSTSDSFRAPHGFQKIGCAIGPRHTYGLRRIYMGHHLGISEEQDMLCMTTCRLDCKAVC